MRNRLLLLSFIEGGAVMAAELCGAKVLAPVYGGSLYVWASVMGITLAALALGYFYGAHIATGEGDAKRLGTVLSAAGLSVLLMPAISRFFIPIVALLPFFPGMLLSCAMLLFPAVFLLGASSPLFISLQTSLGWNAGKASGMVYAMSTAGGIIATFICGFLLIPGIGLQFTLIIFGSALFLLNMLLLRVRVAGGALFFLIAAYAAIREPAAAATHRVYRSEGIMGRLEVADSYKGDDTLRTLKINGIVQTEIWLRTQNSPSPYLQLLDSLLPVRKRKKRALILGIGGGAAARLLQQKNYRCDAVEFDPRITAVARRFFRIDTSVTTTNADARYFLNHEMKRYDLILFDLFKAEEGPGYVLTTESLEQLKRNLTADGLVIINWHGFANGVAGYGTRILCNTLKSTGYNTRVTATAGPDDSRNILVFARLSANPREFSRTVQVGPTDLINTDDLPTLEAHNAIASKSWRTSYLRYYAQRGELTP